MNLENKKILNVFLVRHAQSVKNTQNKHGATKDKNHLTTVGIKSALELHDLILKNHICTKNIYCSSSEACIETAKTLKEEDIAPCFIKDNLRSLDMGIFSGLSFNQMRKRDSFSYKQIELYENGLLHPKYFNIPGFESLDIFEKRIRKAFNDIIYTADNDIIIVGHRSSITMILNIIENKFVNASEALYQKFDIPSLYLSHIVINKEKIENSYNKVIGVNPSIYFLEDITLGINFGTHDSSVALFSNNRLVFASEEERFNREKKTSFFPVESLNHIIKNYYINNKMISIASANMPEEVSKLFNSVHYKNHKIKKGIDEFHDKIKNIPSKIKKNIKFDSLSSFPHHLCHASASYFASGYQESIVLSIDGIGEAQTMGVYLGKKHILKLIERSFYPDSLGKLYGSICRYLGYTSGIKEGKVMALSSFGQSKYIEIFRNFILWDDNFFLPKINMEFFNFSISVENPSVVSDKFISIFGKPRLPNSPILQKHKDIASSLQLLLEEVLLILADKLYSQFKISNLCLSGGVALNCRANSVLKERSKFKCIYIPPYPHDGGLSIGASLLKLSSEYYSFKGIDTPYLGYSINKLTLINKIKASGLPFVSLKNVKETAYKILRDRNILGWIYGNAEFGPRALGNRSILADPRFIEVKEKINSIIKERESFRPFAAVILENELGNVFCNPYPTPYMTFIYKIKNKWENKVPAILHVDKTSRIQTINKNQNLMFYNLVEYFYKKTGIPLLLNTSFNIKYEPIVNNEFDSINTFLNSQLDYMIIENYLVTKNYWQIEKYQ